MAPEGLHDITAIAGDAARDADLSARTATLGAEVKLPPQYEARRAPLERVLTPISNPRAAT